MLARLHLVILGLLLASQAHAQAPSRPPVPADSAVASAKQLIADVYKKDSDAAKTPLQKQALAKKLIDDAAGTKDDPHSKYAMLDIARRTLVGIGDVDGAMAVVDALGVAFAIDAPQQRTETLGELAPLAKTPDNHYALTRYLGRELAPLLKAHRYDAAKTLVDLAQASASKAKDPDLVKQWQRRAAQLTAATAAWAGAQVALRTLETSPVDVPASTTAGKFYCMIDEDWQRGLPLLALGDDKALQALAERELKAPAATNDRLALADAWYDAAATQASPGKEAVLRHSGQLYRQLLPSLAALTLRRVEKRLEEIDAATSPFVKDEFVEILDYVELPKHEIEGSWQRQGLAIVMPTDPHCKTFRIPVVADGAYELRIRAVRLAGPDALTVGLSKAGNKVLFALNNYNASASGLHTIKGQGADSNSSKTAAFPLRANEPYELRLQVDHKGDQVAIGALMNDRRYFQWQGPFADLAGVRANEDFTLGVCHSRIAVVSVQLKMKSGSAWRVE